VCALAMNIPGKKVTWQGGCRIIHICWFAI
jgi:hypothetical protein